MKADQTPLPKILVLASGSGTNLQALIDASRGRDFPGQIIAVGCNQPGAFALERAAQANIETFVVNHKNFESRDEFDASLMAEILRYNPDLIVLAGFMRILTTDFVRAFRGKMLNIHPSLLPKYTGLNTHRRALEAGDTVHGVSIHFVTEELDGGPAIIQAKIPINAGDDAATLANKVLSKEHQIYPLAARWFAEGRLSLVASKAVLDEQELPQHGVIFNEH